MHEIEFLIRTASSLRTRYDMHVQRTKQILSSGRDRSKIIYCVTDMMEDVKIHTTLLTNQIGRNNQDLVMGFYDCMYCIRELVCRIPAQSTTFPEEQVLEVADAIYIFYNDYRLNLEYLGIDKPNELKDPFVLYALYILSDWYSVAFKTFVTRFQTRFSEELLKHRKRELIVTERRNNKLITESVMDNENTTTNSITNCQMQIFGNANTNTTFLNNLTYEKIRTELCYLTSGAIMKFVDSTCKKIDYNIPEQLKMYLQAELNTSSIVVNLIIDSKVLFLTVLLYEGDHFLLFLRDDKPDTLYGISLDEQINLGEYNKETSTRKIFMVDKDDDLSFEIITNE